MGGHADHPSALPHFHQDARVHVLRAARPMLLARSRVVECASVLPVAEAAKSVEIVLLNHERKQIVCLHCECCQELSPAISCGPAGHSCLRPTACQQALCEPEGRRAPESLQHASQGRRQFRGQQQLKATIFRLASSAFLRMPHRRCLTPKRPLHESCEDTVGVSLRMLPQQHILLATRPFQVSYIFDSFFEPFLTSSSGSPPTWQGRPLRFSFSFPRP